MLNIYIYIIWIWYVYIYVFIFTYRESQKHVHVHRYNRQQHPWKPMSWYDLVLKLKPDTSRAVAQIHQVVIDGTSLLHWTVAVPVFFPRAQILGHALLPLHDDDHGHDDSPVINHHSSVIVNTVIYHGHHHYIFHYLTTAPGLPLQVGSACGMNCFWYKCWSSSDFLMTWKLEIPMEVDLTKTCWSRGIQLESR